MEDLGFQQMQAIQRELQEKYKDKWTPLCPAQGRSSLLWMMAEAGEVADVIKQHGDEAIVSDPEVRKHFVEELCDVMMYLNDVMLCYGVSVEEMKQIYLEKHQRNMKRW